MAGGGYDPVIRIISNGSPLVLGHSPSALGLLHGDIYGLSGNSLAELAAVQDLAKLASTEYGTALGGSANHNRNAYFLGLDRQRLGVPAGSSLLKSLGGGSQRRDRRLQGIPPIRLSPPASFLRGSIIASASEMQPTFVTTVRAWPVTAC